MAPLNTFWKLFSAIFPFSDFVYILQLEEYSSQRFLKWLPHFFFRRNFQVRQKVEWTARAKIVCMTAVALWLFYVGGVWMFFSAPRIGTIFSLLFIPFFVLAANAILVTPFTLVHARLRRRAASRLAAFKEHGKVIIVAGSYGKTTTKHFLEQLLRYNFRVQMTPGTVNTPAGIAAWLLNDMRPGTNLLIIEADGYSKREYRETGAMISADIVVVTNIGDQHLERFGSRDALAHAMGEIVSLASENAHILCAEETRDLLPQDILKNRRIRLVTQGAETTLSKSNSANLALARETARILNVSESIIKDTVAKLELPDRRQKPRQMYGYEAIDDSYNISWTTAQAGVAAARNAARAAGKKLLVVTAGIVELGPDDQDKNIRLGELLAREADHTIVLPSMFAPDILKGIGTAPHTCSMGCADDLVYAHAHFDPAEWFLLVQPGLSDLYY